MEEAMTGERHISANLSRFLKGLDFPAHQAGLVAQAKENGAGRLSRWFRGHDMR
jgi:hypothetical protein